MQSRPFWPAIRTSINMLLVLPRTTFIGVCVEFVAAVAWLAELFPEPRPPRKGAGLYPGLFIARGVDGGRSHDPIAEIRQPFAGHRHSRGFLTSLLGTIDAAPSARRLARTR